ncbi:hypothetical protein OEZ85_002198 [Tetradesmus obliquus]|uniref:Tyr recombinase domain-containing protein n=2 Tax=Tetradesmus obliquus TaxID=3088 RepID=A0ABY8U6G1_TETOB|nr:hypothetical protein OEZ85_002198 [Tetradesmus obliquus]
MAPASCLIPSITVSVGPLDLVQRQTCCWEIAFVMNWQEACTGRQQGTQQATSWQLGMAGALSGVKTTATLCKLVRRAMRVAATHAVTSVNQKRPLSRADLRVLVKHLRSRRDFIGDRDAAMFLVGWAGMFRSAELMGIEWRDLQVYEEGGEAEKGVAIYVPYSKTDQAGEGAWVFVAACEDEKEMCPLRALQRLRKWGSADGKVFTAYAGGVGMKKLTVGSRLKHDLRDAGVAEAEQYAAHSLRRGGATHAARQKIALRKIQMMGRWKSDVVRLYLYAAPVELMQAATQMQRKQR